MCTGSRASTSALRRLTRPRAGLGTLRSGARLPLSLHWTARTSRPRAGRQPVQRHLSSHWRTPGSTQPPPHSSLSVRWPMPVDGLPGAPPPLHTPMFLQNPTSHAGWPVLKTLTAGCQRNVSRPEHRKAVPGPRARVGGREGGPHVTSAPTPCCWEKDTTRSLTDGGYLGLSRCPTWRRHEGNGADYRALHSGRRRRPPLVLLSPPERPGQTQAACGGLGEQGLHGAAELRTTQ